MSTAISPLAPVTMPDMPPVDGMTIATAQAGGLGTLGLAPPDRLRAAIRQVRDGAPDRAVAVNLLVPFTRRRHVIACAEAKVDVAVLAVGGDPAWVRHLKDAGVFVVVMVGSVESAAEALQSGADGLIAQGVEAGGHLSGDEPALTLLPKVLDLADGRPVFSATHGTRNDVSRPPE